MANFFRKNGYLLKVVNLQMAKFNVNRPLNISLYNSFNINPEPLKCGKKYHILGVFY